MDAFNVQMQLGNQRDGYVEYPGRLGPIAIIAWHVDPAHVHRVIVDNVAQTRHLRYIVQYFGLYPFQGYPFHVFEGFKCTLHNMRLPEMGFSQAALRMVVMRSSTGPRDPPGTRVGIRLYPLGQLILESMANGLGELRRIGVTHGDLNSTNVVIQTNNQDQICAVKLKGYINRNATFVDSWHLDFHAYGQIAWSVLGPYLDHYPDGHDFVQRFTDNCPWMTAAYYGDPASIKRHAMFFSAPKWLFFLCTLADWMDAFRTRLENCDNDNHLDRPSQSDYELYAAVTNIDLPSWRVGLHSDIQNTLGRQDWNSPEDFLRFARNNFLHRARNSAVYGIQFQAHFRVTPEGYVETFRRCNPSFMINAYNAVEQKFTSGSALVDGRHFDEYLMRPAQLLPRR